MKSSKIFWGISFILAAVLLLLNAFGVISPFFDSIGGVSPAAIFFGFLLVVIIVSHLIQLRFGIIPIAAALLFIIFEKNIAIIAGFESTDIAHNGLVFLGGFMISVGLSILLPNKIRFCKKSKGKHYETGNIGSTERYIDCSNFVEAFAYNKTGQYVIHFTNIEEFTSGATLNIKNNMGQTVIYVPSAWKTKITISNSLGAVGTEGECSEDGPVLNITGENHIGSVAIKYI